MSDIDKPGATLEEPGTQRSASSRFGDLGERFARAVGAPDRTQADALSMASSGDQGEVLDRDPVRSGQTSVSRFRFVWRGYDRAAVDEYISELERDLSAYQAQSRSARSVTQEIERIGAETAAILRVAHEQAEAVTRRAQTEAERCVAEARSQASSITEDAKLQLQALDSETDSVWRERSRLITDVNALADSLSSLAREAGERFPPEVEDDRSVPALTDTSGELANRDPNSEQRDI